MSEAFFAWLDLEHRILKARRPVETAFAAVNLAHALVPYRQAALWNGTQGVVALSGTAAVEAGSPYVLWLSQAFAHLDPRTMSPTILTAADLPQALADQWAEWLPAQAALLPAGDEILLFARDEPFQDGEISLLERLADLGPRGDGAVRPPPPVVRGGVRRAGDGRGFIDTSRVRP